MSIRSRLQVFVSILSLASGAFAFACSSSDELGTPADGGSTDGAAQSVDSGHDAGDALDARDAGDAGDAGTDALIACAYPPYANPVGCPAQYSFSSQGKPCAPVGLRCSYPGMGDVKSDGCSATAMMWCYGDGGLGADAADSGDAGAGTWTVAQ